MKRTLFAIAFLIFINSCSNSTRENNNSISTPVKFEDVSVPVGNANAPDYQWVQLGAEDSVLVRAIYEKSGQKCPDIITSNNNGNNITMKSRTDSLPVNFTDITVCEAELGKIGKINFTAKLANKDIVIPSTIPKKIMTIGDTGCRIRSEDCDEDWHFAKTIDDVASNPKLLPDQVIHVGDYIYRECSDVEKCGKDNGRNWKTWKTDFFEPAKDLLEKAPWVFARGNHESCSDHGGQREWRGWFLFLDPYALSESPFGENCTSEQLRSKPFQVSLDGLDLIIMDSAISADSADYDEAFDKHIGSSPAWFITHRPLWGVGNGFTDTPPDGVIEKANSKDIKFLIAGHIHAFEWIEFDKSKNSPPQMVVGGGATKLETFSQTEFKKGIQSLGNVIKSDYIHKEFTYAAISSTNEAWQVTVIDEAGETEVGTFKVSK